MPRLSKRTLDALAARSDDYLVFDSELPGFGVRVLPSGRKTFLVQYRSGGRTRRVKIGRYGTLTCEEARREAHKLLGEVAKGENPAEDIHTQRRAPTVAAVAERMWTEYVSHRCKPTTRREYRRAIDLFINPALGTHRIGDITRADVAALHHKHRNIPYQANRTLGVLSKLCNLAEIWGLRSDGSNPCRHVPKYRERKRERFLSPAELEHLHDVLDEVEAEGSASPYAVAAFRLLIVTGCRLSEIQTLKWEYVDADYFFLPDSKTGARRIPIGPAVRAVLARLRPLSDNPYVIAGLKPGQYLTDLQRPWRRIRKRAQLTDTRIHDLRHTFASTAIANGVDIVMVGKLLGHNQIQTTMRYAHLADEPVRNAALLVSNRLARYSATETAEVSRIVDFPGERRIPDSTSFHRQARLRQ